MTDIEKDASRYRWLRDRLQVRYMEALGTGEKRQGLVMRVGHGFLDSKIHPETRWTDPRYFDECREKVDAAIDAAAESYNAKLPGGEAIRAELSVMPATAKEANMRETKFTVLDQGDVVMAHEAGYMVTGGDDAVCFYIDPSGGRAYVGASTESDGGCPVVFIDRDGAEKSTEIEFSEFPGWRFHSGGCGKSIAIALVRRDAESYNAEVSGLSAGPHC